MYFYIEDDLSRIGKGMSLEAWTALVRYRLATSMTLGTVSSMQIVLLVPAITLLAIICMHIVTTIL